jgi:hypothetical protein
MVTEDDQHQVSASSTQLDSPAIRIHVQVAHKVGSEDVPFEIAIRIEQHRPVRGYQRVVILVGPEYLELKRMSYALPTTLKPDSPIANPDAVFSSCWTTPRTFAVALPPSSSGE